MHLTTFLLAFLSSSALVAADQWSYHCDLSADGGKLVQKAYCCNVFRPAKFNPKKSSRGKPGKFGDVCSEVVADKIGEVCPNGIKPVCCYMIGPQAMCTSDAHLVYVGN